MSRTANLPGEVYFFTVTVVGWIDVFTKQEYCEMVVKNLKFCQENKNLEIYEYVIMPNHLHLIARAVDRPLSDVIRDFKTYTSKELFKMIKENIHDSRREWMIPIFVKHGQKNSKNKNQQFWQNMNSPILIYDQRIYDQKADYIHNNPVKAGIVTDPVYYYYCSACPVNPLSLCEY